MRRVAVILAGCGSMDGSEIHESTLLLYALSSAGVEYQIFAPDCAQYDVINFVKGEAMSESRNVLLESARIARGAISELRELNPSAFDGLMLPGGFGVAKNLFTFAYDGIGFTVREDVEAIVRQFHVARKPIVAMCIAPLMIAKVLGSFGVEVTLGAESELCAAAREHFGATITEVAQSDIVVDRANRVVTTPAYMYGENSIAGVGLGAQRAVAAAMEL